MYKFAFYVSLFFLSVFGCENEDDTIDCSNIACTLEFRSYTVKLTDADNNPITLDSFQVLDITNNEDLTTELTDAQFQDARQLGIYPLYGDQFARVHRNIQIEIVFKGFINDNEVVNSSYLVGADCCHANIIEGNLEIMLN